eukprot:CAMPEP_0168727190 /NCGR_PEP_ID=MMETSP0724-20121128/5052_1 /TAXON_ID=265536 /ORGANISM="Amphiprora sp., Strain CCMP467" /LENGTH=476 /DNA_ID=CAMNT_0008774019 /DNA_START=107 /DNA_END=1537 /DNA_ORIENTATION=+
MTSHGRGFIDGQGTRCHDIPHHLIVQEDVTLIDKEERALHVAQRNLSSVKNTSGLSALRRLSALRMEDHHRIPWTSRQFIFIILLASFSTGCAAPFAVWGLDFRSRNKRVNRPINQCDDDGDDTARHTIIPSIQRGGGTVQELASQKKPVKLDLSGRLSFLAVSSSKAQEADDEDATDGAKPLFRTSKKQGRLFPSISIGVDYDFNEVVYGATHLISKFRWNFRPRYAESKLLQRETTSLRRSLFHTLRPENVEVTTVKGIWKKKDEISGQVVASWDHGPLFGRTEGICDVAAADDDEIDSVLRARQHSTLSMQLQMDSSNTLAVSTTIPVQNRITWHGRIFGRLVKTSALGPTKFSIPIATKDASWLIPEISVNTIGDLQTMNQVWLPPLHPHGGQRKADFESSSFGMGARIMIRRRCAFDFLSPFVGAREDTFTWLSLEVEGLTQQSRTRARVEAALEDPVPSAQLNIFQDFIL